MVVYKLTRRTGTPNGACGSQSSHLDADYFLEETRRITIPGAPLQWPDLAAQLSSLFDIPFHQVAVSYKDEEGDMITVSSQPELSDHYAGLSNPDVVKLVVFNIESSRAPTAAAESTRPSSRASNFTIPEGNRDTFGGAAAGEPPLAFDLDGPWERVMAPGIPPYDPHGFANVHYGFAKTDSDRFEELTGSSAHSLSGTGLPADVELQSQHSDDSNSTTRTIPTPTQDKGKGRAQSLGGYDSPNVNQGLWSTNSLLGSQAPPKPDVHVMNVGQAIPPTSDIPGYLASTPKVAVDTLKPVESFESLIAGSAAPNQDPDPPLADLPEHSAPSFVNDLAQLLTSLTSAVAQHPELSEGLHNIVQNTTNGAYWATHHASVTDAARRLSTQTAEDMRRAEEMATRRATEAVGSFFRTLASSVNTHEPNEQSTSSTEGQQESFQPPRGPPPFWHGPPGGHHGPGPHRGPPGGMFRKPLFPTHGPQARNGPNHPGPPFPFGPFGGPPPPHGQAHPFRRGPWWGPQGPPPPPPPPMAPFESDESQAKPKPTTSELRAQVEAAKLLYKAEKERYRTEREDRKRDKERKAYHERYSHFPPLLMWSSHYCPRFNGTTAEDVTASFAPVTPAAPVEPVVEEEVVLAAQSRGQFPAMEVVNVPPRRSHTIGHAPSNGRETQESRIRLASAQPGSERIVRRLADVRP